jgi:hypothetical protein
MWTRALVGPGTGIVGNADRLSVSRTSRCACSESRERRSGQATTIPEDSRACTRASASCSPGRSQCAPDSSQINQDAADDQAAIVGEIARPLLLLLRRDHVLTPTDPRDAQVQVDRALSHLARVGLRRSS